MLQHRYQWSNLPDGLLTRMGHGRAVPSNGRSVDYL